MPKFDFIGKKNIWFIVSGIIIIASILSFVFRGLNFGVDFTGGTLVTLKLSKSVDISQVRKQLEPVKLNKSVIQPIGDKGYIIRFSGELGNTEKNQQLADKAVAEIGKIATVKDQSIDQVGPGWGRQVTNQAMWAFILSLGALLIYITLRFELKMATAAIVTLVHDMIFAVGVYSLFYREVTPATVAALLTILGYSLYDTIVMFHKIAENSKNLQKQSYGTMVNASINQVLVRSINASVVTILPVAAILFLGGETLKDFAFALMVGLLEGVYSTIFLASPVLVAWKEIEPRYQNLKRKFGYSAV